MAGKKPEGGGWGRGSSGNPTGGSGTAKVVNRPITAEERRMNKAAETYKTKSAIKDPKKVQQGKKVMSGIKRKAKNTGRKQGAAAGLVVGYIAGESDKPKKKIPGVGSRSGIGTGNSRSVPVNSKKSTTKRK